MLIQPFYQQQQQREVQVQVQAKPAPPPPTPVVEKQVVVERPASYNYVCFSLLFVLKQILIIYNQRVS